MKTPLITLSMVLLTSALCSQAVASDSVTKAQWTQMTSADKVQAIEEGLVDERETEISEIKNEVLKAQIKAGADAVLSELGTDNIDSDLDGMDTICAIGEPEFTGSLTVYEIKGEIVALSISHHQRGGAMDNDEAPPQKHYETEAEAEADGVNTSADVSWQAHSLLEVEGTQVRVLQADRFDAGGFSWSGW